MFQNSSAAIETAALADALTATQIGETCSYETLSAVVGYDVRDKRHTLMRALKIANEQHGALFMCAWRNGYKRLAPHEAHLVGSAARGKVRRTAKMAARKITETVRRVNDMEPAAQRKAWAEVSALALLEHLSRDANLVKKLPESDKPMPVALTLKALLNKAA